MVETAASAPRKKNLVERITAWALTLKPVRVWFHYLERRGFMLADSITYRALFSVFAGVLLGFSFATLWLSDNPQAMQALIDSVDAAIPGPRQHGRQRRHRRRVGDHRARRAHRRGYRVARRTLRRCHRRDRLYRAPLCAPSPASCTTTPSGCWVILRNVLLAIVIGGGLPRLGGRHASAAPRSSTAAPIGSASSMGVLADIATWTVAIGVVFILDAASRRPCCSCRSAA